MKGRELCFHEAVMSNKTLSMIAIYLAPQYLVACYLPASSHTAPRHNIRAEAYFLISPLQHVMDTMHHQTSYAHIFTKQPTYTVEVTSCTYYGKWAPKRVYIYSNHENEWHFHVLFWML